MPYAKKKAKTMKAWRLGDNTKMEKILLQEGVMRKLPNGQYALFSKEAVREDSEGQIADPGDYFKVEVADGRHYCWPTKKKDMEADWKLKPNSTYEWVPRHDYTYKVWNWADGFENMPKEIRWLFDHGYILLDETNEKQFYRAFLWNSWEAQGPDATIVIYSPVKGGTQKYNPDGTPAINFNLVDADYFRDNYYRV